MRKISKELLKLPIIDRYKKISYQRGYVQGRVDQLKMKRREKSRLRKIYNLLNKLSELI